MGSLVLACPAAAAESGFRDAETLFETKVRPLLAAKCLECHGATIAEAVVVPGDSGKSKHLAAVKHVDDLAMPPDTKLSDQDHA